MRDFIEIPGIKCLGKQKSKKQIILTHTSRNIADYINSVRYRNNGSYDKVPNFVIGADGKIYKLLPEEGYSNFFRKQSINKCSIIISLENLGWLEKIPINPGYVNWIGDIYNGEIYEKKWRDYYFWQPYTDDQIISCANLCKYISNKHKIKNNSIGHNTIVEYIEKVEGITSQSNYSQKITCLSPAFDFKKFTNLIANE